MWLLLTRIAALAALLTVSLPAHAAPLPMPAYAEELVARARSARLAEQTTWLRLGHYRRNVFRTWVSEADGAKFFLADGGKSDPKAELEATLRGFFAAPAVGAEQHPQCQFPARFAWLDEQLRFDPKKLPRRGCPGLEDYRRLLQPIGVTLVFSSYYLNNPASAFGHTFLRINRAGRRMGDGRDLLDYGVDYSASVDTDNALLYAFKGLAGLFPGVYRKVPYYHKVREYNDFESRDLWEYELALTQNEVSRIVDHLWELGSTHFAYYYLSENCSYHVLAAIEVARPSLDLLSGLGWPVVPAETVKAITRTQGLVRKVHYRPSNRSQFRRRVEGLAGFELEAVSALLSDPQAALPYAQPEQAKILDAALDLMDFKYARDLVKTPDDADTESSATKQRLLERRAELEVDTPEPELAPPFRKMPHLGHGASRVGMGSGYHERRGYFHALSSRLALHDLADSAAGYPDHAEIQFLPAEVRYYVEQKRFSLEQVSLVRVTSLTPLTRFDRSFSWSLDVGLDRIRDAACPECLTAYGELGGGFAAHVFTPALLVYGMAHARISAPAEGGFADVLRAGLGPSGGLRLRLHSNLAAFVRGAWLVQPLQDQRTTWRAWGTVRWHYLQNFAFGVEAAAAPEARSVQGQSFLCF